MGLDYPYFMVTRGRGPRTQQHLDRLLPLALVPKIQGLRALSTEVEWNLMRCALVSTPHNPSGMDILRGISKPWMVRAMSNLWLSEVRLAKRGTRGTPEEETIDWVLLFDPDRRTPESWQGPADAVIRKDAPVTIRAQDALSKFEVEVIVTPEALKTYLGRNRPR